MRYFKRTKTPRKLAEYVAVYRTLGGAIRGKVLGSEFPRADVMTALMEMQRGLCAFCMRLLPRVPTEVKLAHWYPINASGGDRTIVAWTNMLGVCHGHATDKSVGSLTTQERADDEQTCDTSQRNIVLAVNPTIKSQMDGVRYSACGEVFSRDKKVKRDITRTLNLNHEKLKEQRRAVLVGLGRVFREIEKKRKHSLSDGEKRKETKKMRDRLSKKSRLPQFFGIIEAFVEERIGD